MVDELVILDAAEGWSPALLVGLAPHATGGSGSGDRGVGGTGAVEAVPGDLGVPGGAGHDDGVELSYLLTKVS